MTNPNLGIIEEELHHRSGDHGHEVYDPAVFHLRERVAMAVNAMLGDARYEGGKRAFSPLLNPSLSHEPELKEAESVLESLLKPKLKEGGVRRMFGGLAQKLSDRFSTSTGTIGRGISSMAGGVANMFRVQLPKYSSADAQEVFSTIQDIVPGRYLLDELDLVNRFNATFPPAPPPVPGTPPATAPTGHPFRRDLETLLGREAFDQHEILFLYQDLDHYQLEDYEYAIRMLTPQVTPATPAVPVATPPVVATPTPAPVTPVVPPPVPPVPPTPGTPTPVTPVVPPVTPAVPPVPGTPPAAATVTGTPVVPPVVPVTTPTPAPVAAAPTAAPATPPKPTIYQLRLLANAHNIARERLTEFLGYTPPPPYAITSDDFKKAYIRTYLDHLEFENEDVKRAALKHAVKSLGKRPKVEKHKKPITLDEILKDLSDEHDEFKFLEHKEVAKLLNVNVTDEKISHAIATGEIPFKAIAPLYMHLRNALLSGDYNGRPLSLDENIGPFALRLHKLGRLFGIINHLDELDSEDLLNEQEVFTNIVATEAKEARSALRALRAPASGEPVNGVVSRTAGRVAGALRNGLENPAVQAGIHFAIEKAWKWVKKKAKGIFAKETIEEAAEATARAAARH